MEAAFVIGTVLSVASTIQSGKAQKAMYDAQAAQEAIKGRSEAIKYKQQGADILRDMNETIASNVAFAGANNVDPLSGSALQLNRYAESEAMSAFAMNNDNALIAGGMSTMQQEQYTMAGKTARDTANLKAAGQAATGYAKYQYYYG